MEDNEIIIESFLDGTEVSVGVINYKGITTVLPITEIVSENEFFGKSQTHRHEFLMKVGSL
jgi:D-alanine-D-alanine ligase